MLVYAHLVAATLTFVLPFARGASSECQPYYDAKTASKLRSFPPIWHTAFILPDDTVARAKYNSISASIPKNIPQKAAPTSSSKTSTNYSADDPDCWWSWRQCTNPKAPGLRPDIVDVPEPRTIGYGFDDGPNCSHNAFYDYLLKEKQKATMFFIGSNVMDWPREAQRAVEDGHEIAVHTWSHPYMTSLSNEEAFAEMYYAMQAIKLVTGVTPTSWRPPFGDIDDRIRGISQALGLQSILWKYDTFDWQVGRNNVTPADVTKNYEAVCTAAANGTFDHVGCIMLTHELNNYTMSEAIREYQKLKSNFTYIVPIGVALNKTRPYAESDVVGLTFEQYISSGDGSKAGALTTSEPVARSHQSTSDAERMLPTRMKATAVVVTMLAAALGRWFAVRS